MKRSEFAELLENRSMPLLSDGAMGTMLQRARRRLSTSVSTRST